MIKDDEEYIWKEYFDLKLDSVLTQLPSDKVIPIAASFAAIVLKEFKSRFSIGQGPPDDEIPF